MVTRMEFHTVLKRLGFQLVDDVDGYDESAIGRRAYEKGVRNAYNPNRKWGQNDKELLNNTITSPEEELHPVNSRGAGARDDDRISEAAKTDREIFQSKLRDIQEKSRLTAEMAIEKARASTAVAGVNVEELVARQRGRSATAAQPATATTSTGESRQSPTQAGSIIGVNLLDPKQNVLGIAAEPNPYRNDDHRTAINVNDTRQRSVDANKIHTSATKVQSVFRGYLQRRGEGGGNLTNNSISMIERGDPNLSTSYLIQDVGILSAEQAIRSSLSSLQGAHPTPNLLAGFHIVDPVKTGHVNRKQFAHVMSQFKMLTLTHEQLRACMDYFDNSEGKVGLVSSTRHLSSCASTVNRTFYLLYSTSSKSCSLRKTYCHLKFMITLVADSF